MGAAGRWVKSSASQASSRPAISCNRVLIKFQVISRSGTSTGTEWTRQIKPEQLLHDLPIATTWNDDVREAVLYSQFQVFQLAFRERNIGICRERNQARNEWAAGTASSQLLDSS